MGYPELKKTLDDLFDRRSTQITGDMFFDIDPHDQGMIEGYVGKFEKQPDELSVLIVDESRRAETFYFTDYGCFVSFFGYYSSYDGITFNNFQHVFPIRKTFNTFELWN